MSRQISSTISVLVLATLLPGCCGIRRSACREELAASQLRSQELFVQSEQLTLANNGLNQAVAGLESERQRLSQELGNLGTQLATANSRIDNLMSERSVLKERYAKALKDLSADCLLTNSPGDTIDGFQHDHLTGLNKFPEDIHFDLGSAKLRPEYLPALKEFAQQVNSPNTQGLRVLVVGHTDDQRIARGSTAIKHPTNWHLSTDRADQVILKLRELGVDAERMAAMGYSKYQPVEHGTDNASRQRNRRVELYVVPDSMNVATWDPMRSLR